MSLPCDFQDPNDRPLCSLAVFYLLTLYYIIFWSKFYHETHLQSYLYHYNQSYPCMRFWTLSSQSCNDGFMGCDNVAWCVGACRFHLWVGIKANALLSPFPPLTCTTILSYLISITSMLLLSFSGKVTTVIQPKGMRCVQHVTYWWRWEMHTKFWSISTMVFRRSGHRWDNNIKMDLQETRHEGGNWNK